MQAAQSISTEHIVRMPPALNVDTADGRPLTLNGKIERRIIWNLIRGLWDAGFKIVSVDDREEKVRCDKAEDPAVAAMEVVFSVDEAYLIVHSKKRGGKEHWIKLVGGNGEDIISDWGFTSGDPDGFHAFMEDFTSRDNF